MTEIDKNASKVKGKKSFSKTNHGSKFIKNKSKKSVNRTKKDKDFVKGQIKSSSEHKENKKKKEESEPMEVDYSSNLPTDENTRGQKQNAQKKRQTKGGKDDENKKPRKVQFNKGKKGNLSKEPGASSEKRSLKRKRTEDDEGTKPKKTKMSDSQLTKKEIEKKRKMSKKNYELGSRAKSLWEQLRRFDLTAEKRQKVSQELFNLVKTRCAVLIFAHDTSRVIQSLFKYGSKEHRDAIYNELKDHLLLIIKSKYAKFFVKKALKYGKKEQRDGIFGKLSGHYKKLLKHKEAGRLVEIIYNDFANASLRRAITEEFYGKSFRVFKSGDVKTLGDVIQANPTHREMLLSSLKNTLSTLATKSLLEHSVVHHLFLEYFSNADDAMRTDMIETAREGLIHMLHTRDGSRVAMIGLWHGTAKDRKVIVKTFKTYVAKICKEEYGHLVMLALFDVVDDTKLIQKAILDELIQSIDELVQDVHGRKVLHYLLSPRDPLHFHPEIVTVLQQGDGNAHSKKEPEIRRRELNQYISGPLLQWIVEHYKDIGNDGALHHLTNAIIKHADGDKSPAMKSIAEMAAVPFVPNSEFHVVDNASGNMNLQHLIKDDAVRFKSGEKVLFSKILLDTVSPDNMISWMTCNRGCFMLICLFETELPEVASRLKTVLADSKGTLKKLKFPGAQILLKKLTS